MPETLTPGKQTKPRTKREIREILQMHDFYKIKKKDGVFQGIIVRKYFIIRKLIQLNYFRFKVSKNVSIYIHIDGKLVSEVDEEDIRNAFFTYIAKLPPLTYRDELNDPITIDAKYLEETFTENIDKNFNKHVLSRLVLPFDLDFISDTKNEKFLYYRNGFLRITKDGYHFIKYQHLNKYLWKEYILDRDFVPDEQMGDFELFFRRVCGHKGAADEDPDDEVKTRIRSLRTITGYLLHGFFESKQYGIILTDSRISDEDEANGRTGKTLFGIALGKILNYNESASVYTEINGGDFDPNSKFRFSQCERETKLVYINDFAKNRRRIEVDSFFNEITEGINVEKKNEKPFRIRAKMMFSTNKTIKVEGESALDRFRQFEFSDYYNRYRSPVTETGRWFFSKYDWNDEQWHRFDTFIIGCIVDYFRYGLIEAPAINLHRRTLIDHTSHEFVEFMDYLMEHHEFTYTDEQGYQDTIHFEFGEKIDKKKVYLSFLQEYPYDYSPKNLSQKKFTSWLRLYSKHHEDLVAISEKNKLEGKGSNNMRYFILQLKADKDDQTD